jgi:hypothetical protein
MRSLVYDDNENEQVVRCDYAESLRQDLINELKAYNINRNQHTSDRTIPRAYSGCTANTTSRDLVILAEI